MTHTLNDLYLEHALASYDKRIYLSAMHAKHSWELRLDLATLSFIGPHDQREEYTVQFLGTASITQNSWLWAWANEAMFSNPEHLASARLLQARGQADQITELTAPETRFDPTQIDRPTSLPERLVSIASGLCRAGAHFRSSYQDGALYMLIKDASFKRPVQRPLTRIARIAPMFFSYCLVTDPVRAFEHYLAFYRLESSMTTNHKVIRVTTAARVGKAAIQLEPQTLIAEFDIQRNFIRCALT